MELSRKTADYSDKDHGMNLLTRIQSIILYGWKNEKRLHGVSKFAIFKRLNDSATDREKGDLKSCGN